MSFTIASIACFTPVHLFILGPPILSNQAESLAALVKSSSLNSSINPKSVDVSILLFAESTSNPQTCEKLTLSASIVVEPESGVFLL